MKRDEKERTMVWLTDVAVLRIGGRSNTRYVGLNQPAGPERTLDDISADLLEARRLGARTLLLAGGEPLVRKDVPRILQTVIEHRLVPAIATNGRMLVYEKIRQLILRAKTGYLRVELHGPNARVHDELVGVAGAFDQTLEGLRNLLIDGPDSLRVDVACTVVSGNLEHLTAWVDTIAALPRRVPLSLRLVAPMGVPGPSDWPKADDVSTRVAEALDRIQSAGADLVAAWEGFAPCLLEHHAHARDEVVRCGSPVLGPRGGGASIPLEPPGERSHPLPCQDCIHEPTCPGAPKGLLLNDGEAALRPTLALRANSFNYELIREVQPFHLEPGNCSARSLPSARNPVRSLLLVHDDSVSLYESPTRDFTDQEIARVKDELQQVYADDHENAVLNEFTSNVRRIRIDAGCPTCPDRPTCCGAFRVDPEPPFAREERWLAKEVSRLRGRVLDVGCGDLLYRDELASLIERGEIEYHGLDPDEGALERIRQLGSGGTLHHGQIETFSFAPGYFDYVLVFRSLNHFRDMTRAFEVMSKLMRVHAQMVLCDSPPFAMLRTRKQVEYADDNAPLGHEHYRNWTSHQVVEFLKRFPFRVDVHRPVSAKTSNEWIVKVMRMPDGFGDGKAPEGEPKP
jgi:SAM-dependent methyltransferase